MANSKCNPLLGATVYRNGKSVTEKPQIKVQTPAQAQQLVARQVRETWAWLPPARLYILVNLAFEDVKKEMFPPAGEPFFDAEGRPYSSRGNFLDALVSEITERLFEFAGAREGRSYLLGEPSPERAQRVRP